MADFLPRILYSRLIFATLSILLSITLIFNLLTQPRSVFSDVEFSTLKLPDVEVSTPKLEVKLNNTAASPHVPVSIENSEDHQLNDAISLSSPQTHSGYTPDKSQDFTVTNDPASVSQQTLVTYYYTESNASYTNLKFFLRNGLQTFADFVFIINGELKMDYSDVWPGEDLSNIVKVERSKGDCLYLGAVAEVLTGPWTMFERMGHEREATPLMFRYEKFIILSSEARGPFMPYWSQECWSDVYLRRLNTEIKLIGATSGCQSGYVHPTIWATDKEGLAMIITDRGIKECFANEQAMQAGVVRATDVLLGTRFNVDVMVAASHKGGDGQGTSECNDKDDYSKEGGYFGGSVHPYEVLFVRSPGGYDEARLDLLSEWQTRSNYNSHRYCKSPE